MTHRVILHIGYTKTGSTALQRFLFQNQPTLERAGVRDVLDKLRAIGALEE